MYEGHEWENIPYFEGCLPIEVMAARGRDTLRYGPMKPVGLRDPPHREAAARGRAAPARGPGGTDVEPGGIPDPPQDRRTAAGPHPDPRAGQRRVPALGVHPPQHLPELPRAPQRVRFLAPPPRPALRGTAHGRRGLHRVGRLGDPGGRQHGPAAGRGRTRASPGRHDARRAVPLPARGRSEQLPAHELELGTRGSHAGRAPEEGAPAGSNGGAGRWVAAPLDRGGRGIAPAPVAAAVP